jgi:hypothetical protein
MAACDDDVAPSTASAYLDPSYWFALPLLCFYPTLLTELKQQAI